jgi:hypothetical protein
MLCGAICATMVLLACDKSPESPSPQTPTQPITLKIAFLRDTVLLDRWSDTTTVVLTVRDQGGTPVTGTLSWQSLDPGVAQVSTGGVVKSVSLGTARIRVTATHPNAKDAAQAEMIVRVVLQPNPAWRIPKHSSRGGAVGVLSLGQAQYLTHLPKPAHDGSTSLPVDFDGDGKMDIVRLEYSYPFSAEYTGTMRVFKNTGGGTLIDVTKSAVQGTIVPDHPRDYEIADFTGDGIRDIYVAQHGYDAPPFPGAPNLFLKFSDGRLANQFRTRFSPASSNGFSHGSAAADVDSDGDVDIVEINVSYLGPNLLFLNNGTGNFTPAPVSAFPIANQTRWQEVAFIDFDGDGDPDLYLGARAGTGFNQDVLLVNDGFGRFREREGISLPPGKFGPLRAINSAKAADFNGDGLEDLILFEIPEPFSPVSAIRLWLNNGDGSFTDASISWGLPSQCTDEIIAPLWVRDVNGDGWPDVILPPNCKELNAGILVNAGNRFNFVGFGSIAPWLAIDTATPIDINGSGRPALFFGDRGDSPVFVPIR